MSQSFGSTHLLPATAAEVARREACRKAGCVACRILAGGAPNHWPQLGRIEYHHFTEGVQLGHRFGVALCEYHHQGRIPRGYSQAQAREEFGPSLKLSSKAFHRRFGDDQELLDKQDDAIGYARVTIERERHNPKRSRCLPGRKTVPRNGWQA